MALLFLTCSTASNAQQAIGPPPVPSENPQSASKIALGKALFWEEQLSLTGTVACGTCHRPHAGGSDPRTAVPGAAVVNPGADGSFGGDDDVLASPGVPLHDAAGDYVASEYFDLFAQVGRRKSPTTFTTAYAPTLFWDGRAADQFTDPVSGAVVIAQGGALESQSLAPLLDTSEIGHLGVDISAVADRLRSIIPLALALDIPSELADFINHRDYPSLFEEAFGDRSITPTRIAFALASYQREINATEIPFDRELMSIPTLTPAQAAGRQVFEDLNCDVCHSDALHSDNSFRYIGLRPAAEDQGRFEVTGVDFDRGSFRVPSLRNVELRAPYMHNGQLATLDDVISFYVRGGDFNAPNKDPMVRPRSLSALQRQNLLAYLTEPLTDPRIAAEQPPFDRPTLYSESARVPQVNGSGVTGEFGVPQIVALEPPHANSDNFTIAVYNAPVGVEATLVVSSADPGPVGSLPIGDLANISRTTGVGNASTRGQTSYQLDLSSDQTLSGQSYYARVYVSDPQASEGLSVTRAVQFTVFGTPDRILRDGFE